jgi:pyruvate dehydrogenase E2 component (dihydrolipoamide acetyltransferase)
MKFIAGISSATALICVLSWTDERAVSAFVQSSTTLSPSRTAVVSTIDAITTRFETSINAEAIKITMPALSSTMKEGRVVTWLKSEGDEIEAGEAIMVVESDKADMDVEAFEDGYLAKILTREGETAEVGAVVALVAALQGDIASVAEGGGGSAPSGVVANGAAAAIVAETSPVVAGGKFDFHANCLQK